MFFLLISISSASITVHNSSLKTQYFSSETISGEVNLTINDEDFNSELKSNRGDSLSLKNFLMWNGADYTCTPLDCSNGYESLSSNPNKKIQIASDAKSYLGIVLNGNGVSLSDLSFTITSDFGEEDTLPLEINFFEKEKWKFKKFSSSSFSARYWGCYDQTQSSIGPLIRTSSYCEMIYLREAGSVKLGATVVKSDDYKMLRMKIYPEEGGSSLGTCEFNGTKDEECVVNADAGDTFSEGNYRVCVSADEPTNYRLYSENDGTNCGFVKSIGPSNSVDYAISARASKYKSATALSSSDVDFNKIVAAGDSLLSSKYDRDCSDGCYLPIEISGVSQTFGLANLVVDYTISGEDHVERNVHQLNIIPSTVDFSGILDLELTGFNVSSPGDYKLTLGDKTLVDEAITLIPSPIVTTVSPTNPPAGVPVTFFAGVSYAGSKEGLSYNWDFGDGKTAKTTKNSVAHTYKNISNYTMTVKVSLGNLSSQKTFSINTISPREAVNATLISDKKSLDELSAYISGLPEWYGKEIRKLTNVDEYSSEIDRLMKARDSAYSDDDYIKIATDLYKLDIPVGIFSEKDISPGLTNSPDEVRPSIIANFAGGSVEGSENAYKQAILNWQIANMEARISNEEFFLIKSTGIAEGILMVYDVNVKSKDDYGENYFVINAPIDELYFEADPSPRKADTSTLIVLNEGEEKSFKFYYDSSEPTSFFASPGINSLVIEAQIDETCNYNKVCEEDFGETYKNCRSDCKPVGLTILYLILLLIFFVLVYTILQIWYERRYESHLFRDRRELYNLLMYIANAKARGKTDSDILRELRKKGWSGERLSYAIRKANGKRTGLPELIPITLISTHLRNRKAQRNIATASQQQIERKVNKSGFQQTNKKLK